MELEMELELAQALAQELEMARNKEPKTPAQQTFPNMLPPISHCRRWSYLHHQHKG